MNLAELFRHETELQDLAAGSALFLEGDKGDLMYVLISGSAEITVNGRLMETAQEGAILGEMAMIDEVVRSATVVAKTNCKLFAIEQKRFNFLIQQTPNFATHVMKVIAKRLRRTDELVAGMKA
jgi:CRP-like cAMP-binding protein